MAERVGAESPEAFTIDTTVPHAARVYDYFLGGTTNFAVDREAAEQAAALVGGMDRIRSEVRANRAFLGRAVRFLIHEAGIRQFLDIGTGIPDADNVAATARSEAPESCVISVDKDPVVMAHAHLLLRGTPQHAAKYLREDVRNPERILGRAAELLDLRAPVAVMLIGLLHHLRDRDRPAEVVARLMAGVPAGSYLAVSHLASDIDAAGVTEAGDHLDDAMAEPMVLRSRDAVAAFFGDLEMVEPGLVQVDEWRPTGPPEILVEDDDWTNPLYVGVARKRR